MPIFVTEFFDCLSYIILQCFETIFFQCCFIYSLYALKIDSEIFDLIKVTFKFLIHCGRK
jgi:hypothetical protein